jgi:hypothetical protein
MVKDIIDFIVYAFLIMCIGSICLFLGVYIGNKELGKKIDGIVEQCYEKK